MSAISGEHLRAARIWVQGNKHNGSDVKWGSDEVLQPPMTMREVEEVAEAVRQGMAAVVDGLSEEAFYASGAMAERDQLLDDLQAAHRVLKTLASERVRTEPYKGGARLLDGEAERAMAIGGALERVESALRRHSRLA